MFVIETAKLLEVLKIGLICLKKNCFVMNHFLIEDILLSGSYCKTRPFLMNDILCFISGKELAKLALTLAVTSLFSLPLKQKIKWGQSTIKVYVSNQKPLFVFKPITWAGENGTQWPIKQPNVTLKMLFMPSIKIWLSKWF